MNMPRNTQIAAYLGVKQFSTWRKNTRAGDRSASIRFLINVWNGMSDDERTDALRYMRGFGPDVDDADPAQCVRIIRGDSS